MLRLGIALVAAVAALFGGARDQFAKLDPMLGLMVVFALGFGADTIKNLITRPTNS